MTGIEVGVAVIIGVLLGRFLPNRRKGPKVVQPVCGCGHHHSYHDVTSGACAHVEQLYIGDGKYKNLCCTCRQYSGPVPMPEYYAPELSTGEPS